MPTDLQTIAQYTDLLLEELAESFEDPFAWRHGRKSPGGPREAEVSRALYGAAKDLREAVIRRSDEFDFERDISKEMNVIDGAVRFVLSEVPDNLRLRAIDIRNGKQKVLDYIAAYEEKRDAALIDEVFLDIITLFKDKLNVILANKALPKRKRRAIQQ